MVVGFDEWRVLACHAFDQARYRRRAAMRLQPREDAQDRDEPVGPIVAREAIDPFARRRLEAGGDEGGAVPVDQLAVVEPGDGEALERRQKAAERANEILF